MGRITQFLRSWLTRYILHDHLNRKCNLSIDFTECVTRDNVIRTFLSGWSWNEYPNVVLQRKLLSSSYTNWAIYSARFPYVIDYNYTMYSKHAHHKGNFLFTDAKDRLLVVECNYVSDEQLQRGGSTTTRHAKRNKKRKALMSRIHTLVHLVHNKYPGVVTTEGVIVTGTEIKHVITLYNGHDNGTCTELPDYPLLIDDDGNKSVGYDDWRLSYWPRDTSYDTCIKRDKILRDYFIGCTWSNDPEFNIIRKLLLDSTSSYTKQYPLFYDYEYLLPLANGVCMGDCLFTDGRNNFMAVEVKSLLPGELYNPSRKANTARRSRRMKRTQVTSQAAHYANHWHKCNPQVAKTEGVVVTDRSIERVITLQ